jgi:hypothetical protein
MSCGKKYTVSLCCGDQLLCKECAEENDRLLSCQNLPIAADVTHAVQPTVFTAEVKSAIDVELEAIKSSYDNELLCFLQNKKQLLTFDSMIDIVVDFYKSDEIESAR